MSVAIRKTRAKIFTFTHSMDTTSPMSLTLTGTDITARIMTNEDGPSSRRVKVNAVGPGIGPNRAALLLTCAGISAPSVFVDVDPAPSAPASFSLTQVSDEVDPD